MSIVGSILTAFLSQGASATYTSAYTSVVSDSLSTWKWLLSTVGFVWWFVMMCITYYGFTEIIVKFRSRKAIPPGVRFDTNSDILDSKDIEGVTILRPIKGVDSEMELCLESALLQRYPKTKFQVLFCVESERDPAVPIIQDLIARYRDAVDVQLLVDDNFENNHSGPNPKINNLTKGFKNAKFDIVWILDSNVWVNPGTLLRSVTALKNSTDNGRPTQRPIKLVHHVPLAIAVKSGSTVANLGAQLDEMFLHTSHAKFYVFFNKASVAPCVNGKSNMYRISDLDAAVESISRGENPIINNKPNIAQAAKQYVGRRGEGIRFFARYIGEDNMIGIALWETGRTGMTGDVVIQPIGGSVANTLMDYVDRRVRWLRVRKYMVMAATLVEPTTESILIGLFGTYGISNLWFDGRYRLVMMCIHEIIWCFVDYIQSSILQQYAGQDQLSIFDPPFFVTQKRPHWVHWCFIWVLREMLAFPVWLKAMCGSQIDWRNRPFKINPDLSAEEL
jgi:ceramide glucosyltransferase